MYQFIYKLKYGSEVYKCNHAVTGYEDEGVKFGKASEDKGVIKSYTAEIQLICNDANFIRNILVNHGFNELVKFEVYKDEFINGEILQYSGQIDLSTCVIYDNRITFMLKEGGFITTLDNLIKREVTIRSGFSTLQYSGNSYDFDVDLISDDPFDAKLYEENGYFGMILPIKLKENSNNYENLGHFKNSISRIYERGVAYSEPIIFTNDDVFFNIKKQETLMRISMNLNIDKFELKDVIQPTHPTRAKVHYVFIVRVYKNGGDQWTSDSNTSMFIHDKAFSVQQEYVISTQLFGSVNNQATYNYTGLLTNGNTNYASTYPIADFINSANIKGCKIVIDVIIRKITLIHESGEFVLTNDDIEDVPLILYPKIDIKMRFEGYELVHKPIEVIHISDVYNKLVIESRGQYNNLNVDLSKLVEQGIYLTSSSLVCGKQELTTSLEQFLKFVYYATGLRHIIDYRNGVYHIYFEKYENSFKNTEIAKIENVSDIVLEIEADKIFTDIEIGNGNKESAIFKDFEYNTINKFKTANSNTETKTYSLISPYLTSVTDLETIIYNFISGKESEDSNEVYAITGVHSNSVLINTHAAVSGPNRLCNNIELTPKRIIEKHKFELSDMLFFNGSLKFNSSKGKADIVILGVSENTDYQLVDQMMNPFIFSFSGVINESVLKVDHNKYGYFTFKYGEDYIRGWIAEGSDSVSVATNGNKSDLRLIVKKSTLI